MLGFGCGDGGGARHIHGGLVVVYHRHRAGEFGRFGAVMPRVFKGGGLAGVFQRQGKHVGAAGDERGAAKGNVFAAHADACGCGVHVKIGLAFQAAF